MDVSRGAGRLIVGDRSPIGDAVLDATLETVIRWQGRRLDTVLTVIGQTGKKVRKTLYERLVSMVRYERRRILGDRWPAQDSGHKAEVRGRMIQALVEQATPDTRNAALIALLHTIEHKPAIVDPRLAARLRSLLDFELFSLRDDLSNVARRSPTATGHPRLFTTRSTQ